MFSMVKQRTEKWITFQPEYAASRPFSKSLTCSVQLNGGLKSVDRLVGVIKPEAPARIERHFLGQSWAFVQSPQPLKLASQAAH
jgi:hypothetical protein